MTPAEAARILGVGADASADDVRAAYRHLIRAHHPDRAGTASAGRAASITEAFRVLRAARPAPSASGAAGATRRPATPPRPIRREPGAPAVQRLDGDTLLLVAPADETFRWLLEAAHDVGEVTYVDRSMPIAEVLCQFEGEPATSLVLTLQGRGEGTEVFCTVESIEARPAPPVAAVVDLLELALHRRRDGGAQSPSSPSTAS